MYRTKGVEQPSTMARVRRPRFGLLIRHDDEREFVYDADAEHALAEAAKRAGRP